jgi:hypothetical protein
MRAVLFASVTVFALAGRADAQVTPAGGAEPFAGPVMMESVVEPVSGNPFRRGMMLRTVTLDHHSGEVVPTVARAQPVVGSIHRTLPFHQVTPRAGYVGTAYNPALGQFKKYHFRR